MVRQLLALLTLFMLLKLLYTAKPLTCMPLYMYLYVCILLEDEDVAHLIKRCEWSE